MTLGGGVVGKLMADDSRMFEKLKGLDLDTVGDDGGDL